MNVSGWINGSYIYLNIKNALSTFEKYYIFLFLSCQKHERKRKMKDYGQINESYINFNITNALSTSWILWERKIPENEGIFSD